MTTSPLPPLSLPEWVVLAVVDESPTHGFAVASLTEKDAQLGRVWQIPRPVIYRALRRLEDDGLVAPTSVEPGRGPQRQLFRATPDGHRVVRRWLETPVDHVRDVRSRLLTKLALLDRRGVDATRLLRRQREVLTPIAEVYDEPDEGAGFDRTLHAWRRASARATLSFIDEVMATPTRSMISFAVVGTENIG